MSSFPRWLIAVGAIAASPLVAVVIFGQLAWQAVSIPLLLSIDIVSYWTTKKSDSLSRILGEIPSPEALQISYYDRSTEEAKGSLDTSVPGWDKIDRLTDSRPKIVLMGDSVLDNFIWMKDQKNYLRIQLDSLLSSDKELKDWSCINLAIDETSTFDFIVRSKKKQPWTLYEERRREIFPKNSLDDRYFASKDGHAYSIENLKRLKNVKAVVVSVGGNDVYIKPEIQTGLALSLLPFQSFRRKKIGNEFLKRIAFIFKELKQAAPEALIIPVIVYHPHYEFSISGLQTGWQGWIAKTIQKHYLSTLVGPMAKQFVFLAEQLKLPVLDLSRTFDPTCANHYGTQSMDSGLNTDYDGISWSGAEPSNVSSMFIAQLVQHIVKRSAETSEALPKKSIVYYGETSKDKLLKIREEVNEGLYSTLYAFGRKQPWLWYLYGSKEFNLHKSIYKMASKGLAGIDFGAVKLKSTGGVASDKSGPKLTGYLTETEIKEHTERVLDINLEHWIEELAEVTFPTAFVPLTVEHAKALILRYEHLNPREKKVSEAEYKAAGDTLADVKAKLDSVITEWNLKHSGGEETKSGSGVFVKLSCRSAKDATITHSRLKDLYLARLKHLSLARGLSVDSINSRIIAMLWAAIQVMKVHTAEETFWMFENSERIWQDMNVALEPTSIDRFHENICVRKWVDVDVDKEFRGFVCNGRLNALSQYNHVAYFPWLVPEKDKIAKRIQEFWESKVKKQLDKKFTRYVVDFGITDNSDEVVVIELNPFEDSTDAALFSWKTERKILEEGPFEIRVKEKEESSAKALISREWRELIESDLPAGF